MLTFEFTGATGRMTESEKLTAGTVGKEVRFVFSQEWDGLRKVAVFASGDVSCAIVDVQEVETIPAAALAASLRRLYVGVYGISEDGQIVIPTIYATGPFIHIGAASSGDDSDYEPEDAYWQKLEETLSQSLRYLPQELTEEQQRQSRENIGAVGENPEAAELLMQVLKDSLYDTEHYDTVIRFGSALYGIPAYRITRVLEKVAVDNAATMVLEQESYQTALTPKTGCAMDSVTVTMDGVDITDAVYSDGILNIPAVTGDVVITAAAVRIPSIVVQDIKRGYVNFVSNLGLEINGAYATQATMVPAGQYMDYGIQYRISLGAAAAAYMFDVQIMVAKSAGLTYPYVAGTTVSYNTIGKRLIATGWRTEDYQYTATQNNLVLSLNFKRANGAAMTATDYALLLNNLVIEELE